jgi:hypothetical protein
MKDVDKPIEIIKHKGKHRTETRVFARNIHETFCTQPKCKFSGQHAQQGICHTTEPELVDWDRIDKQDKQVEEELEWAKKRHKGSEYVKYLEAMYSCVWLNWQATIDECIKLRRDNALLKLEVSKR